MNRKRFVLGFCLASSGIGLMLAVAVGALQDAGLNGGLSLPSVALCMIIGLMLLGGGFGIMATSTAQYDDGGLRSGDEPGYENPPKPLSAAACPNPIPEARTTPLTDENQTRRSTTTEPAAGLTARRANSEFPHTHLAY